MNIQSTEEQVRTQEKMLKFSSRAYTLKHFYNFIPT